MLKAVVHNLADRTEPPDKVLSTRTDSTKACHSRFKVNCLLGSREIPPCWFRVLVDLTLTATPGGVASQPTCNTLICSIAKARALKHLETPNMSTLKIQPHWCQPRFLTTQKRVCVTPGWNLQCMSILVNPQGLCKIRRHARTTS